MEALTAPQTERWPLLEWVEDIGRVFTGAADGQSALELVAMLKRACDFDHCVVFAYSGEEVPLCLFHTFSAEQYRDFVSDYQAGPYLLDPFYKASYDAVPANLYGIRDLAPDHFFLSEYYLSYYRRMLLRDEIGYFGEAAPGIRTVVSLMRADHRQRFDESEKHRLRQFEPLVRAFVANLWRDGRFGFGERPAKDSLHERLEQGFLEFGKEQLTRREQQICRLLLRGHSSASISKELSICAGTVKIHRKNLYAKLGVSSHSELFLAFLDSIRKDG